MNPTKFMPTLEELKEAEAEEKKEAAAANISGEKKRPIESDSEGDSRKKRQKTEFLSAKKTKHTDAWCPDEEEEKILEGAESDSSDVDDSDVGFNAKELEAELLGLSGDPVNSRPYRVRPVDPETQRRRSHAKRNRLVGKPMSKYLGVSWCNKKQQWHGRVWVSHLKKLEWVGYFVDEVECAKEVNKRCVKLGLPIKNPELEDSESVISELEVSEEESEESDEEEEVDEVAGEVISSATTNVMTTTTTEISLGEKKAAVTKNSTSNSTDAIESNPPSSEVKTTTNLSPSKLNATININPESLFTSSSDTTASVAVLKEEDKDPSVEFKKTKHVADEEKSTK